ncbi:MAG: tryptophan transporter [Firmicutes bacterium]|nr:tryptophan transporter [Bacillota bacterium]
MSREKSTTRDLALAGLMIAAGVVLHSFPPLLGGMKPDFALIMLVLFALLRRDKKITIVAGLATGIVTALTTGFPGGQIPNIIDKILTTFVLMGLTMLPEGYVSTIITTIVGTLFSGGVFLGSALLLVGLPAPFKALFTTIVLPAAVINTVAVVILYPIAVKLSKMLSPKVPVKINEA